MTLWILVGRADPSPNPGFDPSQAGKRPVASASGNKADARVPRIADVSRSEVVASSPAEASANASNAVLLHGTFLVVDQHGIEQPLEHGRFQAVLRQSPTSSTYESIDVHEGQWQCRVEEVPYQLEVARARSGDHLVACEQAVTIADTSASIDLRGRLLPAVRLRVVDSETRVDLTDLEVVTVSNHPSQRMHPGDRNVRTIQEGATSPLEFDAPVISSAQTFWARAPGHAWNAVNIDTMSGDQRVMHLVAGGGVKVAVQGGVDLVSSYLRVRRVGADLSVPIAQRFFVGRRSLRLQGVAVPSSDTVQFVGLPVGAWDVSLEEGSWAAPLVHGRVTVTIARHTTVAATIEVDRRQGIKATAPVSGTMIVPSTWGPSVSLVIASKGRSNSPFGSRYRATLLRLKRTAEATYSFNAGLMQVGDYQVYLEGTDYRTSFTLPAAGRSDLVFAVSEPCAVQLRIVDAETNLSLGDSLAPVWFCKPKDWLGYCEDEEANAKGDGTYHCTAPSGPITFRVHSDGYRVAERTFDVLPGSNEFLLRVQRDFGVEVILRDGINTVPWPDDLAVQLVDGDGKSNVAVTSGNKISAVRPSECVLSVSEIAGFEPIEKQRVVVSAWQWTTVEIQLRGSR